jgi:hypothetical protein
MNLFYELPQKSSIAKELLHYAMNEGEWHEYYNFHAMQVPDELAFKDVTLRSLNHNHKLRVGILRLDPYVCYDWHVDTSRGVCVNMLLNDVESKCLFSIEQGEITRTFKELKYKPETYYLFNNQVEHTVINFTQNRYLMSVEFEEGKDVLTFNNLLKEII